MEKTMSYNYDILSRTGKLGMMQDTEKNVKRNDASILYMTPSHSQQRNVTYMYFTPYRVTHIRLGHTVFIYVLYQTWMSTLLKSMFRPWTRERIFTKTPNGRFPTTFPTIIFPTFNSWWQKKTKEFLCFPEYSRSLKTREKWICRVSRPLGLACYSLSLYFTMTAIDSIRITTFLFECLRPIIAFPAL